MNPALFVVCCLVALLSACSSQPPIEKHTYTLHPATDATEAMSIPTVALGSIDLAPYLRHEGIVIETSPGEVHYAKHNLWADSLSYSVRRYLQVQLRKALAAPVALHAGNAGAGVQTIDVRIHELHGTQSGSIRIVATWSVRGTDAGTRGGETEFHKSDKIANDGYSALVQGHKSLLDALAKNIAANLPAPEVATSGDADNSEHQSE